MPRPAGSLNAKTLQRMVDDGDLCILANRANCVKCRAAREADNAQRVARQVEEQLAAMPEGMRPRTPAPSVMGSTRAILVDTFVEYRAPDGKEWRVERGMDLLLDFDIQPSHVTRFIGMWHAAMAGQDRVWLILRRLYGIAPMLGVSDADEMRVWPVLELATKLGLTVAQVEGMVGESKLFWKRYRATNQQERKSVALDSKRTLTADEVATILERYDLSSTVGEPERRWAAKRCMDLEAYLEHDTGRPMAISAIRQELLIFYVMDARIAQHQAAVAEKIDLDHKRGGTSSVNEDNENKRLMDLMEARAKANKAYEATMTSLGATQVQTGSVSKRQNFQLCLGAMIEGVQKFMADADNDLVDGFATEAEILLVTREKDIRPGQYRPDVVIMWEEAMQNLWDRDYEPTPIGRARSRQIRACYRRAIAEMREKEGEGSGDILNEDELLIGGDTQTAIAPSAPVPPGFGEQGPVPQAMSLPPRRTGDGDNDVAVF